MSSPPEPPSESTPTVPKPRFRPKWLLWLIPMVVCLYFQWQIVCLHNLNESVQMENLALISEIASLHARVDALEPQAEPAAQPGTLLSDYTFDLDLYETEPKLTVTFTGVPYTWQNGNTATLCISGSGIEPKQIPCQWDGAFLTAALVLDIADGYELCLAIDHADGSRQLQILNHSVLNQLESAFSVTVSGNVGGAAKYLEKTNSLEFSNIYIAYSRSDNYIDTPVTWQDISLVLCLEGVEIARSSQGSYNTEGGGSIFRAGMDFSLGDIALQPNQEISLLLYTRQSNGIEATCQIGCWRMIADGILEPIRQ